MDPVVKLVIEAACLVSVFLLAALSVPILGGKRLTWSLALRSGAIVVGCLVFLYLNPRGWPDPFPVVIGVTVFVAFLVGLVLALTLGWRFTHREQNGELDRQTGVNFAATGMFGLLAAACLLGAIFCIIGIGEGLGAQSAYDHAPRCAGDPSNSCRAEAEERVVRTWAESSRGRHWIEVIGAGRDQTIEVETANDVWSTLVSGSRVVVTSWKGHVTEVSAPGVGSMQTVDSPSYNVFAGVALLVGSLIGLLFFSLYGLVYWLKWRAGLRGIDTSKIAA